MSKLSQLWNIIFPPKCVFCKKNTPYFLCPEHQKQLQLKANTYKTEKGLTVYSISNYDSFLTKKLVFLYKFFGIFKISDAIAKEIVQKFSKSIPENSILIPIPLHWSRFIWRGYNQATKLAQSIQVQRNDLIISTELKRTKKTKQQAALNKKEREANMKNVFQWKGNIAKEVPIFLIDDVFTSGATMHAAQATLQKQGFSDIQAIVFARTQKNL